DSVSGISPSASDCNAFRSETSGDDWSHASRGSYTGCDSVTYAGDPRISVSNKPPTIGSAFGPPAFAVVPSPSYETDRTYFYGAVSQLWRFGPVETPDDSGSCALDVVGGFGGILNDNPDLQRQLGCPRE